MLSRLLVRPLCAALLITSCLCGEERNAWPLAVRQVTTEGITEAGEYLGPFFFQKKTADNAFVQGFRPFYLRKKKDVHETSTLLYPFFTWDKDGDYRNFSFFNLVNFRRQTDADLKTIQNFDAWPFYFSRDTGDPATSYRAFFPIGGTIKNRFGKDRIHFVLFPLYSNVEKSGSHTTHAPWPFLRFIDGADDHGFEFWPLFGHRGRAGDYDSRFYLWPLIYKTTKNLSESQPDVKLGVLPFYSRDTAPGYINENYFWPFFGYTHRTTPIKYDEKRYLWPIFIQGRGDARFVNRWAPLYTHSVNKGVDKTWIAWPVFRHSRWEDGGIAQDKKQLLFLFYWSLTQRSISNPAAAPASKTHLWPLVSIWDNGAGSRQVQLLSPFEVLFPTNEPVRQLYSPLLAIYRFDQRTPEDVRHSILFSLLSWKRSPSEKEFHVGPLFSRRSTAAETRVALALGLLSWRRQIDTGRWKFSLFDFRSPSISPAPVAISP